MNPTLSTGQVRIRSSVTSHGVPFENALGKRATVVVDDKLIVVTQCYSGSLAMWILNVLSCYVSRDPRALVQLQELCDWS